MSSNDKAEIFFRLSNKRNSYLHKNAAFVPSCNGVAEKPSNLWYKFIREKSYNATEQFSCLFQKSLWIELYINTKVFMQT